MTDIDDAAAIAAATLIDHADGLAEAVERWADANREWFTEAPRGADEHVARALGMALVGVTRMPQATEQVITAPPGAVLAGEARLQLVWQPLSADTLECFIWLTSGPEASGLSCRFDLGLAAERLRFRHRDSAARWRLLWDIGLRLRPENEVFEGLRCREEARERLAGLLTPEQAIALRELFQFAHALGYLEPSALRPATFEVAGYRATAANVLPGRVTLVVTPEDGDPFMTKWDTEATLPEIVDARSADGFGAAVPRRVEPDAAQRVAEPSERVDPQGTCSSEPTGEQAAHGKPARGGGRHGAAVLALVVAGMLWSALGLAVIETETPTGVVLLAVSVLTWACIAWRSMPATVACSWLMAAAAAVAFALQVGGTSGVARIWEQLHRLL